MESVDVVLTVSLIWVVAAVTPGPNFFITVHSATCENRRSSFYTILGIVTGTCIWAVSGFLGITLVFKMMPAAYTLIKLAGGMYLMYRGLRLIVFSSQADGGVRVEKSMRTCFSRYRFGLLTNLLNPKTAAFMTSVFAAAVPQGLSISLGLLCVLSICLISGTWYSIVALIFSCSGARSAYVRYRSSIERLAGLIFILFGMKMTVSE